MSKKNNKYHNSNMAKMAIPWSKLVALICSRELACCSGAYSPWIQTVIHQVKYQESSCSSQSIVLIQTIFISNVLLLLLIRLKNYQIGFLSFYLWFFL